MGWASFRLTPEDRKKLDALAEKKGMTISEVIRDMIRIGYEQKAVSSANEKIEKILIDFAKLQKESARILRIVTLLGEASPFVSKQMKQE